MSVCRQVILDGLCFWIGECLAPLAEAALGLRKQHEHKLRRFKERLAKQKARMASER